MLFAVLLWKCGEVVVCSACQATFFVMVLHGVRYAYSFLLRKKWLKKATLPSGAVTVDGDRMGV